VILQNKNTIEEKLDGSISTNIRDSTATTIPNMAGAIDDTKIASY
jgi:hypothetical protein